MTPLGNDFQDKKCARCRQEIHSDPAYEDHLWWHHTCLQEGKAQLLKAQTAYDTCRAEKLAQRFGFAPEHSCNS